MSYTTDDDVDLKNIYYNRNTDCYFIQKTMYGKRYYYGSYHTLEEALQRRDELRSNDWCDVKKRGGNVTDGVGDPSPRKRVAKMYGLDVEEIP